MANQIISPITTGAGSLGRSEIHWGNVYTDGINGGKIPSTGLIGVLPGTYTRDQAWAAKAFTISADRYVLLTPNRLAVDVNGTLLALLTQSALDLSLVETWDTTSGTDYTLAANRAGRDFYVYACLAGGTVLQLVVSANTTYPNGYSVTTSRKVAGFHCLCAAVRHDLTLSAWAATTAISLGATRRASTWDGRLYRCSTAGTTGSTEPTWSATAVGGYVADGTVTWIVEMHALEGYAAGDILPTSVWDLRHRPAASPEGMVFDAGPSSGSISILPPSKAAGSSP